MATEYPMDDATLAGRAASAEGTRPASGRMIRHAGVDRGFHWITALTMFVLLATSLLPVVGIRFAWVEIHWIAGLVLTAAVLFHLVRSLFFRPLRLMVPRPSDVAELGGARAGKYSLAQKLMHLAFALALLTAIVTGILLMIKAGTPIFERDPYVFSLRTWGVLTILHDLSAFGSLFLVMLHVYFSLRPEKRLYLRAMVSGWVSREELRRYHDTDKVDRGE
jgi:formate dehydrogenase subunit gamma